MRIELSGERREILLGLLTSFYAEEFDEEISAYRASRLLDHFLKTLGPGVYNQAIQDARGFMQERLDDLDVEFYESEPGD